MPENGQSMDFSGGTSYKWIGDMINSGIMTQHQARKMRGEMERNPCDLASALRELLGAEGAVNSKVTSAFNKMRSNAAFLPDVVAEIFERRGNFPPGSHLSGGKTLGEYAIEVLGPQSLIPQDVAAAMAFAAPFLPLPIAILQPIRFVDNHMPTGLSLVTGSWYDDVRGPSSSDERLPNGVFLSPLTSGPDRRYAMYKGPVIRQLIDNWMRYEINNVESSDFPSPRRALINLAGTWEGSGPYGIFDPAADEVLPNSKVATLLEMQARMRELELESRTFCNELTAAGNELARDTTEAGISLEEQRLANERLAAERKAKQNDYLLVGGLVLGAFIAARAR